MDKCPKCLKELKIWQLSQYCPYCGANIMFANYEPRFQKDRRMAEMSGAYFRTGMERFKSAYISGLPQKMKILFAVLPLIGLVIPFGKISVESDFFSGSLTFWVLDLVYNAFLGEGYFSGFSALAENAVLTGAISAVKKLMLFYALAAVSAVLILLTELLCFTGNKKSAVASVVFAVTGMVGFALVPGAVADLSSAVAGMGEQVTMSHNALWLIGLILFLFPVFGAVWCLKKPPVRHYSPEDAKRCEYRAKWKKGEIALLDIPAPIAETEEEKKEKAKLIRQAYHETGEENDNG